MRPRAVGGGFAFAMGATALTAALGMIVRASRGADWREESRTERGADRPGPDSGRVAKLLDALETSDPVVCALIADQLGNFWIGGASHRLTYFADEPRATQSAKDSVGGRVTDPRAIGLLIARLGADNPCARRVTAKLLGSSLVPSDRLFRLLDDPSPRIREAAAFAVGEGERKAARPRLERLLSRQAGPDAAMAAWALGSIEDSAAAGALRGAVSSRDNRTRAAVAWALGNIHDVNARADLERLLLEDSDSTVRVLAAEALGEIGSPDAAPALGRALSDSRATVRVAAANAIGDLHDLRTAPQALVRAARSGDSTLQSAAARALAEIKDPATLDVMIELLGSGDRETRLRAIQALQEFRSPKSKAGLLRALRDSDPEIRRAAAEALGQIEGGA